MKRKFSVHTIQWKEMSDSRRSNRNYSVSFFFLRTLELDENDRRCIEINPFGVSSVWTNVSSVSFRSDLRWVQALWNDRTKRIWPLSMVFSFWSNNSLQQLRFIFFFLVVLPSIERFLLDPIDATVQLNYEPFHERRSKIDSMFFVEMMFLLLIE